MFCGFLFEWLLLKEATLKANTLLSVTANPFKEEEQKILQLAPHWKCIISGVYE